MGLLGNLISNAVSDGIGKGIQDAVGKAVESAVKPAADKLAGQAANQLNQATQNLTDSGEAAAKAASAPAPEGEGMASLGAALSGWASAMEGMAGQVAQNMKECPSCGEVVTADHKFCPKCGAQLPEQTIGAGYVCPKCGKQNAPGTTFCAECGAMLPAAEAANAAQLAKWDSLLPCYPKWEHGGSGIELEELDDVNGHPGVSLSVRGAGLTQAAAYVQSLKAAGFVPYGDERDADVWYKVIDGVCRAFDKTDCDSSGDGMYFTFFVGDYDKRMEAKAKADAARDTAKDTAKAAADAAKGLFKKFF